MNTNNKNIIMTTNVKNNNSSSFSLKEVEHKTTSSPSSSAAATVTALSPAVHQISTICSVSDTKSSIIFEQDNSHIVKIKLTDTHPKTGSTNFRQIFNNNINNNSSSTTRNNSKVSYVSIGLPSAAATPSSPVVAVKSPLVTSLLVNKAKSTITSFIKLDSNKENYTNKSNNSVTNLNNSETSNKNHSEYIKSNEMVQKSNQTSDLDVNSPYYYYMATSGQCSPSDTLDSGTCSDLEVTPPPVPKKMSPQSKYLHVSSSANHNNNNSGTSDTAVMNLSDSDESQLSLSCDSLNGSDLIGNTTKTHHTNNNHSTVDFGISVTPQSASPQPTPPPMPPALDLEALRATIVCLPDSLLKDIRDRSNKLNLNETSKFELKDKIEIRSYLAREQHNNSKNTPIIFEEEPSCTYPYENDKYYNFHINENVHDPPIPAAAKAEIDESFAGYKDIKSGASTIRSAKGTVRGVKNRVRNGIATFLQMQHTNIKNYKEKDAGKVVLYTTSMGILRDTYARCVNMKQILRTLLIKFEERDVFMSNEYQLEIKDRMQSDKIIVPQLFVDGQHIGDADCVERLNETGELRIMLKPYKCLDPSYTCQLCGGYRLLPCQSCNGSKKSVHRNHFTAEFIALKCMNCDEVGLVKCYNC